MIVSLVKPATLTKPANTTQALSRSRILLEILLLVTMVELLVWTDSAHVLSIGVRGLMRVLSVLTVGGLLYSQRPSLADFGLAPRKWTDGLVPLLGISTVAAVAVLFVGWYFGTLGQTPNLMPWVIRNFYMEGVQQLLLQVLLAPRLALLAQRDDGRISAFAAVIFSLLHAPNGALMALTLVAGFVWREWYRRYRNLPALWLSHLTLATVTLYAIGPWLRKLRVGIGYVYYSG